MEPARSLVRGTFGLGAPVRQRCAVAALAAGLGCQVFGDRVETEVGDAEYCAPAHLWDSDWDALEADLAIAIDHARVAGGTCGETMFGVNASGLEPTPELRCISRMHARDMGGEGAISHTGSDGKDAFDRAIAAEYSGVLRGELLASQFDDVDQLLSEWLANPDQCAALLSRSVDQVGVGLWKHGQQQVSYWVVTLGSRRD